MNLRLLFRSTITATALVAMIATPVVTATPASAPARAAGVDIRIGQASDFSHIEFHWAGAARMSTTRQGQTVTLAFSRDANPDMATLHAVPVRWLKSAQFRHAGGALQLVLNLADDADVKTGDSDGAPFINIFAKRPDPTPPAAAPAPVVAAAPAGQVPSPTRADPTPKGGVVSMAASINGPQLRLDFPWRNPAGAAVFRRGDAIWVVFDTAAKIDVSHAPRGVPQYVSMQSLSGPGYSAVRIVTRAPVAFVAEADGATWSVTLEPFTQPVFTPLRVSRADATGPAALTTAMSGSTGVYWIDDPAVGDRFAAVTAVGPAKGLPNKRDFVQLTLLQSAQGLGVEPHVEDLAVAYSGDLVTFSRPAGLTLSNSSVASKLTAAASMGAPKPAAMPALIASDWGNVGEGGFLARYDALMVPVAGEEEKTSTGTAGAHMALARFLVGSELSFEAIGVLNDALRTRPALATDAEFRGLRGIAKVMAGRFKEAETDFASPALADDPASAMWRGYIDVKASQWADAKREFAAGTPALNQFSPIWKARFGQAAAQAALAQGDTTSAHSWIGFALSNDVPAVELLHTRLIQAQLFAAEGNSRGALRLYQALETAPGDDISGPALLRATQIQMAQGAVTPVQAAATFDSLRYRWRGGAFELETIRALGQLYLTQGRYREALDALRSAGKHMPDLPEAVQLQADLAAAFRSLFLDGQADGLEPVQALALFEDFKELTPIGADGDLLLRKLTRRLVDVDLLPQAEDLLKYQVDNRLDGVAKAQVATDLAVLYLMDRKPEQALDAINGSRTTILPTALNAQRRIVSARALSGLARYDVALEMLGNDNTADGNDVRAEIAWRQKTWPQAGALMEKMMGDRFKQPGPLSADDEGKLLRAGVAYSLAGDDASLTRLRDHYGAFVDKARNPDALRVALSGINGGQVSVADFSRVAADNQSFEGWVAKMKDRFRSDPLPGPHPAQATRQVAAAAPATTKG